MNVSRPAPRSTPRGDAARATVAAIADRGGPVIIGLSGGVDSVVLTSLVATSGVECRAVHVHHHLRADAWRDELAARAAAQAAGVPFEVHHLDGRALRASPSGWEASARTRRYAVLADVAASTGATVVTAHTAGDRLENVLLRLSEGAGACGLAGPRAHTTIAGAAVWRPLLGWWRRDIESYALTFGLRWHEDPSNTHRDRRRARLRYDVARPLLEHASPQALGRSLAQIAEDAELLEYMLDAWLSRATVEASNHSVTLRLADLREAPSVARSALVRRALTRHAIGRPSRAFIERVAHHLDRDAPWELDGERTYAATHGGILVLRHVAAGRGSDRARRGSDANAPHAAIDAQRRDGETHLCTERTTATDAPLCNGPKSLGSRQGEVSPLLTLPASGESP
jgi:tRNA(Ile)-lysidine synthase